MRTIHLQLLLIGAAFTGSADAQIIQVKLDLGQPRISNERTVSFFGRTNLPAGTKLDVRSDLAGRPLPPVKGTKIVSRQQVSVAADGSVKFTLDEQSGFKTGKYRLTVQAWVYGASIFGSSKPQAPEFYVVAGDKGENLRGPLMDRKTYVGSHTVAVTAVGEFEFSKAKVDVVARKEKPVIRKYSKAIDDAYAIHVQLRDQGVYAGCANEKDLRSNRIVVDYGLRLKKSHDSIRRVRTQEAFFLLTETINALDAVHYWSLPNMPPGKYAQAVTDYEAAKTKLDAFIVGIQ